MPEFPKGNLKLSDVVEDIEYIPLETKNRCLLGEIRAFDISDNYIVVYCISSTKVYLFHRNGQFIAQLGDIGQGPKEYLKSSIFDLLIDEKNNEVIIHTSTRPGSKFLIYDLKGKYVRTEKYAEEVSKFCFFRIINDDIWGYTANFNGNRPYAYEIRTRNMDLITANIKTTSFEFYGSGGTFVGSPKSYLYADELYVKEVSLNDTIYAISKNHIFSPKYIINAGKYEITVKEREGDSSPQKYFDKLNQFIIYRSFFETKENLLLSYSYQEKQSYVHYDKKSKKLSKFASSSGIPNDYDGGISLWPQRQDNNIWYSFYNAHVFEDELSTQTKYAPKGPKEAVSTFNQLMKKLGPEDNPVLVIMKVRE